MRSPLFPIALVYCLGIYLGLKLDGPTPLLMAVGFVLYALLSLLWSTKRLQSFNPTVLLMLGWLGLIVGSSLPPRLARDLAELLRNGKLDLEQPCRIKGMCLKTTQRGDAGEQITLSLKQINNRMNFFQTRGNVRLSYFYPTNISASENQSSSYPAIHKERSHKPNAFVAATVLPADFQGLNLKAGDQVEIFAKLSRPRNFRNPGAMDIVGYLARQDIFLTGTIKDRALVTALPTSASGLFLKMMSGPRQQLLDEINRLFQSNPTTSATLRALLAGEKNNLPGRVEQSFQETGTYHALVVSGQHVMIIAFFLVTLLTWIRVPRWIQFTVINFLLFIYAGIAEFQPSIVRASLMCCFFLLGQMWDRRSPSLNSLSLAGILVLLIDPRWILDAGFQLSFSAVLAIVLIGLPLLEKFSSPILSALRQIENTELDPHHSPRLADLRVYWRFRLTLIRNRFGEMWYRILVWSGTGLIRVLLFLWDLLLISVSVHLLFLPLMAFYFHRLIPLAPFTNLIILPFISLLLPLGFLVIMISLLLPGAGNSLALLVAYPTRWLLDLVEFIAAQPWTQRRIADLPEWFLPLYILSLLGVIAFKKKIFRVPASLVWLSCVVLLLLPSFPLHNLNTQMEMTMLDVGQGDCFFIQTSDNGTLLIDGGGLPGSFPAADHQEESFDIGEKVVAPFLWKRKIEKLDVVVATHEHHDHLAGLISIIRIFHPREVWTSAGPLSPTMIDFLKSSIRQGVVWRPWNEGQQLTYRGIQIDCLNPSLSVSSPVYSPDDRSLVFFMQFKNRSFLYTGDISRKIDQLLLSNIPRIHCDVLKIAHHGSRNASSEPFISALNPVIALISVSRSNPFNHPHPDTLNRLEQHHIATLRTDRQGVAILGTDGKALTIQTASDLLIP
jgi:competence protein ComEC